MKIQAHAQEEEAEGGALSGILGKVGSLLGDNSEQQEEEGREEIVKRLANVLNDNFSLLRDFPIPGTEVEVPMLLIGPPGVKVVYPFTQPGIFNATNANWLEMNERKNKFEPAKVNFVAQTMAMSQGIQQFLEDCGVKQVEVEPLMLLSDLSTHVDTENSVVKVVSRDGITNFASSLLQDPQLLKSDDIFNITSLISRPALARQQLAKARGEVLPAPDAASDSEIFADSNPNDDRPDWLKAIDDAEPEIESTEKEKDLFTPELMEKISNFNPEEFIQKLGFTTVQWVLLAAFAGTICLTSLVAFLLIFLG